MAEFGFPAPSREGHMEWHAASNPRIALRTWYGVWNPANATTKAPLVVCHGGPGIPHGYVHSIVDLLDVDRPVIFYDQVGCGRSTFSRDPEYYDLWEPETYIEELHLLIQHLKLDSYFLLGQSWGGYLIHAFAAEYPAIPGLLGLISASGLQDGPEGAESIARWIPDLPKEMQEIVEACEAAGDFSSPEYKAAVELFYSRHVLRKGPMPPEVLDAFKWGESDVYIKLNGNSEMSFVGKLRTMTLKDKVHKITAPVLLIWGQYDTLVHCQRAMGSRLTSSKGVKLVELPDAGHLTHYDQRETFNATVDAWMSQYETKDNHDRTARR